MPYTLELESLEELKLLTDALLGTLPEESEEEREFPAEMDPLIDKILSQAEAGEIAPYTIELDEEEAQRLADALEAFLDLAAESGDVFGAAEVEGIMRRLGRGM